jgi:hypothetical protein
MMLAVIDRKVEHLADRQLPQQWMRQHKLVELSFVAFLDAL